MAGPPRTDIEQRLAALRASMRRERAGAVYVTSPANVRYFTGFTGDESSVLVSQSRCLLLTDFRYIEEAEASAPLCEVVRWKTSMHGNAGKLARSFGVKRIGFEERHLTVDGHERLRREAGPRELVPLGDMVSGLRRRKSDYEVRVIKKALRIAEAAFTEMRAVVVAGATERDLARELEWRMGDLGAEAAAFPSIVACDANASLPHAHAGRRKVKKGGMVLVDWGARVDGYCSDLTRTLFIDSIPPRWRRRYDCVLEAQLAAIEGIAEGTAAAAPDDVARTSLKRHDLEQYFGHGLGHGVGLDVHEGPSLGGRSRHTLEAGNVVTVEPGVYFPRRGGIRIEDMALVTADGATILSRLPKVADRMIV